MRITGHITVYSDDRFYSAFPSIVCCPDGELLVAFRRAPDVRRYLGQGCSHCHPNSYLVLVRSTDNSATWTDAAPVFAHPRGGSQDPCMTLTDDGALIVGSYAWTLRPNNSVSACSDSIGQSASSSLNMRTYVGDTLADDSPYRRIAIENTLQSE